MYGNVLLLQAKISTSSCQAAGSILTREAATEADAQTRYEELMENNPPALSCPWNLIIAMRDIDFPSMNPGTYLKQLIWQDIPERDTFAPARDLCYAYADNLIVSQVKLAAPLRIGLRLGVKNELQMGRASRYTLS